MTARVPPRRTARRRRFIQLSIAVTALAVVLAACRQPYPQNSLSPAGPVAEQIDNLFTLSFWLAVAVFVVVEGLLIYAIVRFRHRGPEDTPTQVHGNTRLEVAWTIVPTLLLAVIAVPTIATLFDLSRGVEGDVLEIEVDGRQWWWDVRYPQLDIHTANEIHIPVDRPVRLTLTSDDVIHSFWVPRLAGKQDMVPGRTHTLGLVASEPGVYLGQCAEYCGLAHTLMRFRVVAESPGDFDAWARDQQGPAAEPAEGTDAADGLAVFRNPLPQGTGACIACHAIRGVEGAEATVGPNLTHFGSRQTLAGGILPNTPEALARWLRDPPAVKEGSKMPNYDLSDEQIEDLVAYLRSLE